jgi:hypothetical protein
MKKILSFLVMSVLSVPLLAQTVVWQSQQNFEVQRLRALKSIGLAVRDTAGGVGFSNRDSLGTMIMGLDRKVYVKGLYGWEGVPYASAISVGLSAPSVFSVTGSPVSGSGTLALGFATGQAANQVLATPDGVTGALGLRALVANDIPGLDASKIATGIVSASRLGTGTPSNANFLRGDGVYSASLVGQFTVAGTLGSTTTAGNQFSSKYDAGNTWTVSTGPTGLTQITGTGTAARTQFNQIVTGRVGFRIGLTNPGTSADSLLVKNADSSMRCISPVIPIARGGIGLTALGTALQQLRVNAGGTALEYFSATASTLDAVTTAGNTTANTVNVGGLGASGPAFLNGGLHLGIRTTTASGAVSVSDYTVLVNNTSDVVLTLPAASAAPNSVFKIKKISANSNTVTISPAGADVIESGTPLVFSAQWKAVEIQSNGSAWYITGLGPL